MSRPSDPPWMHNDIRKFIRARKRLHNIAKHNNSPGDWAKYRKTRNICVNKSETPNNHITIKLLTY